MTLRILFVVSGSLESASPRYRAVNIAEALHLGEGVAARVVSIDAPYNVDMRRGDVVVLHRIGFAGAGERFVTAARRARAVSVWSTDDLLFTPDFGHQIGMHFPDDTIRYRQHRDAAKDFARMLSACDAALVSTEYLAQRVESTLSSTPHPVFVIRNFLSSVQIAHSDTALRAVSPLPSLSESEAGTPVTIAYLSGSATHNMDLATVAVPLASVLSRFPQARLLVVGPILLPPVLQPFADAGRIARHSFVPWPDLPGLMTHCRVDINLAPLDTSRAFSHAKSEVKYLEAAALGIPTIASLSAGFAEGVKEHECLLASNSGDWERCLSDLIVRAETRLNLGRRASEAVRERGTSESNALAVRAIFERIASRTPARELAGTGQEIVWVQPALLDRVLEAARRLEHSMMRRYLRGVRHLRLLREDVGT
ncbi:MAG: glycosyltransferase [Armatimonadota bacterium]